MCRGLVISLAVCYHFVSFEVGEAQRMAGSSGTAVGLSHPFAPIIDAHSRVLVLGSFPSVKSRERGFYYGHPQNRFWAVLAALCAQAVPRTADEKGALLLCNGIALWDVLAGCDILGSSDARITNPRPNDIAALCGRAPIERVYLNGKKAGELYTRFIKDVPLPAVVLPSTSPANAAWSLARLIEAWSAVIDKRGGKC